MNLIKTPIRAVVIAGAIVMFVGVVGWSIAQFISHHRWPTKVAVIELSTKRCLYTGWGKAAQLVDVQGEVRQLVEVKLNVVRAPQAVKTIEGDCIAQLPAVGEIDTTTDGSV